MTHRTARVYLDPDEARCEPPAGKCTRKPGCGRWMAAYPARGLKLADFTADVNTWREATCSGFVAVAQCVPPAPVSTRRTHPPLGAVGGTA